MTHTIWLLLQIYLCYLWLVLWSTVTNLVQIDVLSLSKKKWRYKITITFFCYYELHVITKNTVHCHSLPPNNPHPLDCLYVSLSSPPVAGVWWAHTLDWLYVSLSSPPVAGVWWAHTLDWLYDSLSSPPVAGVWWAAYTWLALCTLSPLHL